jgi:hypothetical protein
MILPIKSIPVYEKTTLEACFDQYFKPSPLAAIESWAEDSNIQQVALIKNILLDLGKWQKFKLLAGPNIFQPIGS